MSKKHQKIDFGEILRERGIKATGARLAILNSFPKVCKPINAEQIFKNIRSKKIDQVTVYRTLSLFEKIGILKRVDLRKDSTFYEMNVNHHHHHHIVCNKCGLIENLEECNLEEMTNKMLKQSKQFISITDHSFELFGVCKSCILV